VLIVPARQAGCLFMQTSDDRERTLRA